VNDVPRHLCTVSRDIAPVELRGLEPLTPSLRTRCATSCATAPGEDARGYQTPMVAQRRRLSLNRSVVDGAAAVEDLVELGGIVVVRRRAT
jgi:hypothetical protein